MTRREAKGPLSWLKVVDLTDLRGAMCARVLADLGADVIRVEQEIEVPLGDLSLAHRYRNANKRGVVIDCAASEGRARLDALLSRADVLVENLDADKRRSLGLTHEIVASAHP